MRSFVSEHIETLEEIDVEYKELALRSGIERWGRVPALGCEPTFISDLADAVIESLPYVGAMAVSNLEARQVINADPRQFPKVSTMFVLLGLLFYLQTKVLRFLFFWVTQLDINATCL